AEGYVLNDKRRVRQFTAQQYFKTQAEMAGLFSDLPEALQNSVEIAKRCNLTLHLGKPHLPDFPTAAGVTLENFLRTESERGLHERMLQLYPDESARAKKLPEYSTRLAFEIATICKMGFPGYFLIVADFIRWAKNNGVPVGPGRGSGAGSLVAYSLGITNLDPLRYGLLFERFLNPERVSMPDFDIDFCQDGRERVIEYVKDKYGAQCVSQIATFGTLASKAVIRDVGRVLDFPYGLCDRLSKLVPLEGVKPVSLKKAREIEPEFNVIIGSEEGVEELLELGERLEDLIRNVGMHAGGVLIAPGKLTDFCPLYYAEGSDKGISQFDKDDVESIGLVKFDFLGLRTLTIIDWAVRHVNRLAQGKGDTKSSPLTLENLPLDDAATYELLKKSNTTAVFQLESRGMKDMLGRAKPDCFEDIIALVALYRPGPMDLIPDFTRRKHGEKFDYPHPAVEPVLRETYGIMVYQEQVMQMAQIVGGYSLGEADLLRRAMGKKKPEEMAQQREKFMAGALQHGTTQERAGSLFDMMEKFAGYGFNKSHAAAYALVAYQTAYLKANYPAAFMAATLSGDLDNTEKVSIFYADTLQQNIRILLPDVNSSGYAFSPVDDQTIAYGLGAIKGTGESAINSIVKARASGTFKDLFDFCSRVDKRAVNRRTIEALIKAGAFDNINNHRAALMATVDAALTRADQQARAINQNSLFGDDDASATLQIPIADVPRWSLREQLAHEKASLGIYLGGHPFQEYADELAKFIKIKLADLTPQFVAPQSAPQHSTRQHSAQQHSSNSNNSSSGSGQYTKRGVPVVLAGIVAGVRIQQTRRGRMAVITLDDGSAQVEMTVFNEEYERSRPWIREDELLLVRGKASLDEYSGNVRVSGEELFDLATARSVFAKRLELRVRSDSGISVPQLVELLQPYRDGKCPLVLHYSNASGSVPLKLGEAWHVTLHQDLMHDLGKLLGKQNVKIAYS
ncbi:MAG: DNA polymerase III subunit alpha, partial [Candidatus Nitrotoga sp.]